MILKERAANMYQVGVRRQSFADAIMGGGGSSSDKQNPDGQENKDSKCASSKNKLSLSKSPLKGKGLEKLQSINKGDYNGNKSSKGSSEQRTRGGEEGGGKCLKKNWKAGTPDCGSKKVFDLEGGKGEEKTEERGKTDTEAVKHGEIKVNLKRESKVNKDSLERPVCVKDGKVHSENKEHFELEGNIKSDRAESQLKSEVISKNDKSGDRLKSYKNEEKSKSKCEDQVRSDKCEERLGSSITRENVKTKCGEREPKKNRSKEDSKTELRISKESEGRTKDGKSFVQHTKSHSGKRAEERESGLKSSSQEKEKIGKCTEERNKSKGRCSEEREKSRNKCSEKREKKRTHSEGNSDKSRESSVSRSSEEREKNQHRCSEEKVNRKNRCSEERDKGKRRHSEEKEKCRNSFTEEGEGKRVLSEDHCGKSRESSVNRSGEEREKLKNRCSEERVKSKITGEEREKSKIVSTEGRERKRTLSDYFGKSKCKVEGKRQSLGSDKDQRKSKDTRKLKEESKYDCGTGGKGMTSTESNSVDTKECKGSGGRDKTKLKKIAADKERSSTESRESSSDRSKGEEERKREKKKRTSRKESRKRRRSKDRYGPNRKKTKVCMEFNKGSTERGYDSVTSESSGDGSDSDIVLVDDQEVEDLHRKLTVENIKMALAKLGYSKEDEDITPEVVEEEEKDIPEEVAETIENVEQFLKSFKSKYEDMDNAETVEKELVYKQNGVSISTSVNGQESSKSVGDCDVKESYGSTERDDLTMHEDEEQIENRKSTTSDNPVVNDFSISLEGHKRKRLDSDTGKEKFQKSFKSKYKDTDIAGAVEEESVYKQNGVNFSTSVNGQDRSKSFGDSDIEEGGGSTRREDLVIHKDNDEQIENRKSAATDSLVIRDISVSLEGHKRKRLNSDTGEEKDCEKDSEKRVPGDIRNDMIAKPEELHDIREGCGVEVSQIYREDIEEVEPNEDDIEEEAIPGSFEYICRKMKEECDNLKDKKSKAEKKKDMIKEEYGKKLEVLKEEFRINCLKVINERNEALTKLEEEIEYIGQSLSKRIMSFESGKQILNRDMSEICNEVTSSTSEREEASYISSISQILVCKTTPDITTKEVSKISAPKVSSEPAVVENLSRVFVSEGNYVSPVTEVNTKPSSPHSLPSSPVTQTSSLTTTETLIHPKSTDHSSAQVLPLYTVAESPNMSTTTQLFTSSPSVQMHVQSPTTQDIGQAQGSSSSSNVGGTQDVHTPTTQEMDPARSSQKETTNTTETSVPVEPRRPLISVIPEARLCNLENTLEGDERQDRRMHDKSSVPGDKERGEISSDEASKNIATENKYSSKGQRPENAGHGLNSEDDSGILLEVDPTYPLSALPNSISLERLLQQIDDIGDNSDSASVRELALQGELQAQRNQARTNGESTETSHPQGQTESHDQSCAAKSGTFQTSDDQLLKTNTQLLKQQPQQQQQKSSSHILAQPSPLRQQPQRKPAPQTQRGHLLPQSEQRMHISQKPEQQQQLGQSPAEARKQAQENALAGNPEKEQETLRTETSQQQAQLQLREQQMKQQQMQLVQQMQQYEMQVQQMQQKVPLQHVSPQQQMQNQQMQQQMPAQHMQEIQTQQMQLAAQAQKQTQQAQQQVEQQAAQQQAQQQAQQHQQSQKQCQQQEAQTQIKKVSQVAHQITQQQQMPQQQYSAQLQQQQHLSQAPQQRHTSQMLQPQHSPQLPQQQQQMHQQQQVQAVQQRHTSQLAQPQFSPQHPQQQQQMAQQRQFAQQQHSSQVPQQRHSSQLPQPQHSPQQHPSTQLPLQQQSAALQNQPMISSAEFSSQMCSPQPSSPHYTSQSMIPSQQQRFPHPPPPSYPQHRPPQPPPSCQFSQRAPSQPTSPQFLQQRPSFPVTQMRQPQPSPPLYSQLRPSQPPPPQYGQHRAIQPSAPQYSSHSHMAPQYPASQPMTRSTAPLIRPPSSQQQQTQGSYIAPRHHGPSQRFPPYQNPGQHYVPSGRGGTFQPPPPRPPGFPPGQHPPRPPYPHQQGAPDQLMPHPSGVPVVKQEYEHNRRPVGPVQQMPGTQQQLPGVQQQIRPFPQQQGAQFAQAQQRLYPAQHGQLPPSQSGLGQYPPNAMPPPRPSQPPAFHGRQSLAQKAPYPMGGSSGGPKVPPQILQCPPPTSLGATEGLALQASSIACRRTSLEQEQQQHTPQQRQNLMQRQHTLQERPEDCAVSLPLLTPSPSPGSRGEEVSVSSNVLTSPGIAVSPPVSNTCQQEQMTTATITPAKEGQSSQVDADGFLMPSEPMSPPDTPDNINQMFAPGEQSVSQFELLLD